MKLRTILGVSSALCLSAMIAHAQETNELEQLKKQVQQQQQQIDALIRKVDIGKNFERLTFDETGAPPACSRMVEVALQAGG